MNVVEARVLTDGLRCDWAALRSMLTEAIEGRAWELLDYARVEDWLADTLGDVSLPGMTVTADAPPEPPAAVQARVSRPGRRRSTIPDRSLGRTDVTPRFKR